MLLSQDDVDVDLDVNLNLNATVDLNARVLVVRVVIPVEEFRCLRELDLRGKSPHATGAAASPGTVKVNVQGGVYVHVQVNVNAN